jgi:hypothetical protein
MMDIIAYDYTAGTDCRFRTCRESCDLSRMDAGGIALLWL